MQKSCLASYVPNQTGKEMSIANEQVDRRTSNKAKMDIDSRHMKRTRERKRKKSKMLMQKGEKETEEREYSTEYKMPMGATKATAAGTGGGRVVKTQVKIRPIGK